MASDGRIHGVGGQIKIFSPCDKALITAGFNENRRILQFFEDTCEMRGLNLY